MLPNWIFVIKDTYDKFERRMCDKSWPIFKFTRYRKELRKGDSVIFYMAGHEGKKFLGKARLESEPVQNGIDFLVALSKIEIWQTPVDIGLILRDLRLVTQKHWGLHFQGGIIRLPDEDYHLISSKGKTNAADLRKIFS